MISSFSITQTYIYHVSYTFRETFKKEGFTLEKAPSTAIMPSTDLGDSSDTHSSDPSKLGKVKLHQVCRSYRYLDHNH